MAEISGFAFPPQLDQSGDLKIAYGSDYILGLIHTYLLTYKAERLGLLDYGIDVYVFDSYPNFALLGQDIQRQLSRIIPQAEFECRAQLGDSGEGLIDVFWSYLGTAQEPVQLEIEGVVVNG